MGLENQVKILRPAGVPRRTSRHPAIARLKWNKEVNKVVSHLMRKEDLLGDTERECFENGEKGECLNQQSNVCVTRQGQLKRMAGYQNLNWKQ